MLTKPTNNIIISIIVMKTDEYDAHENASADEDDGEEENGADKYSLPELSNFVEKPWLELSGLLLPT